MLKKWTNILVIGMIYLIATVYVVFQLDPMLFYFTQQPAFLTEGMFFTEFIRFPGGIGQYISLFFEQFFMFSVWGAIIMTGVVLATALFTVGFIRRLTGNSSVLWVFGLFPLAISLILWQNLKFPFSINLQLLITAAFLFAWINLIKWKPVSLIPVTLILALGLYHISGPVFLYIFALATLITCLVLKDKFRFVQATIIILFTLLYPFLVQKVFLPISLKQAYLEYTPMRPLYLLYKPIWVVYLLFACIPVSTLIVLFTKAKDKLVKKYKNIWSYLFAGIIVALTIWAVITFSNKDERLNTRIAQTAYKGDWPEIIKLARMTTKYDRMVNFYLNQAFFHTRQMDQHLFDYQQVLGTDGLFIDYPLTGEVCMPSSYLYYQLGLTTNALRFAYESQTLLPNSPYVLMQIINSLIVLKDFNNARCFLNQLDKNMLYHDYVKDRLAFIDGKNSELKSSEVERLRSFIPITDFYTASPQLNLIKLVERNPDNQMALEYLLSWCLLKNNLGGFINQLIRSKNFDPLKLPKTYQEAMLIYWALTKNPMAESEKVKIDPVIKDHFNDFTQNMKKDKEGAYRLLSQRYPDSYWLYFVYDNPMVTKSAVKTRQVLPKN